MGQMAADAAAGLTSRAARRHALRAHEYLGSSAWPVLPVSGLRGWIRESWERSLAHHPEPGRAAPVMAFSEQELEDYRSTHPLAAVVPVIRRLLVEPGMDAGLIVAVGDSQGRLLWVEGGQAGRRRAERISFVPGMDWSERSAGTSAPGTALVLNRGIQISEAEHFNRDVHAFSCTAVPLHDPLTGSVLGVLDITGSDAAVSRHSLPLLQAAAAAAEAELRIHSLEQRRPAPRKSGTPPRAADHPTAVLRLLGTERPELVTHAGRMELSLRHAEILALLAVHPEGLSAEVLSSLVYAADPSPVTLRAEMVRLRRLLADSASELVPASRPYRLGTRCRVDAVEVLELLQRGFRRKALDSYAGVLLPLSEAPGIVQLRRSLSGSLREAMLSDAAPELLWDYSQLEEAAADEAVLRACLHALPLRSPRRAAVVSRLEALENADAPEQPGIRGTAGRSCV